MTIKEILAETRVKAKKIYSKLVCVCAVLFIISLLPSLFIVPAYSILSHGETVKIWWVGHLCIWLFAISGMVLWPYISYVSYEIALKAANDEEFKITDIFKSKLKIGKSILMALRQHIYTLLLIAAPLITSIACIIIYYVILPTLPMTMTGVIFAAYASIICVLPFVIYQEIKRSMVGYVFAEQPDIKVSDAIRESKRLIKGNMNKLISITLYYLMPVFIVNIVSYLIKLLMQMSVQEYQKFYQTYTSPAVTIASLCIMPFAFIATIIFYKNLKKEKQKQVAEEVQ